MTLEQTECVCFLIHQRYVDMLDELADLEAEGNRTQMFIKLIEKQYRIKKDFQQWKSDDEIRRSIRDSFKKKEYENGNIMFSPSTKRPIGDN